MIASSGRRILALWFPRLPTDRLQRNARTAASDAPPLVIAAKLGNALRISALDRKASQLGLRPYMPLANARARVDLDASRRQARELGDQPWDERHVP